MADYLENLLTARDNVAANLAAITADPKPNYTVDGQSVSWQSLFDSYMAQLEKLDAQINGAQPFEVRSRGLTEL